MIKNTLAGVLIIGLLLSVVSLVWAAEPSGPAGNKALATAIATPDFGELSPPGVGTPEAKGFSGPEPAQLPPGATGPGMYILYDEPTHNLDQAHGYPVSGGHHRYGWSSLEPNYDDDYRFDELVLPWVESEVACGKKVAFGFTTYNGRGSGGGLAVPSWLWARDPSVRFDNDGWYLLNYLNRTYVNEYREFIQAFANWVASTPVVRNALAWVEVGTGQWGENQPARKFGPDGADWTYYAYIAGGSGWSWTQWRDHCIEVHRFYRDAFNAAGLSSLPIVTNIAPTFRHNQERDDIALDAVNYGVGLKNSGILPDHDNGARSYAAMITYADHATRKVPMVFEIYGWPYLTQAAEWYWTALCALDKHADYYAGARELVTDPEWRAVAEVAQRYAGVTIDTTPDVWVALRETFRVGQYLYPEKGNYSFWLYQDDYFMGKTVTETYRLDAITENVRNRLGQPVYNPNLGTAKEGWTTRRTSQGDDNPYMWFKIDDRYMYGTSEATIEVTYYDWGTDKWSLRYDSASGDKDAIPDGSSNPWVQKTDSRTWKTATFSITDGSFSNRMAGDHDFRIDCRNDGDEWIHMVKVRRGGESWPTPTPTRTSSPTATPTTPTGLVQIQLYTGPNLVAYSGQSRPIAEALASIEGKYTKVFTAVYEYNASQGKYQLVWKQYIVGAPPFVNTLTHLEPWHGYWIYVSQDCVWTINP